MRSGAPTSLSPGTVGIESERHLRLCLYVAGDAPISLRAITNLTAYCREKLKNQNEIEIIDVFENPEHALESGILLTAALSIESLSSKRTIVDDLSEMDVVKRTLALENESQ